MNVIDFFATFHLLIQLTHTSSYEKCLDLQHAAQQKNIESEPPAVTFYTTSIPHCLVIL